MVEIEKKPYSKLLFYIAYSMAIFYWMFTNVKGITNYRNVIIKIVYVILILICFVQSRKYSKKFIITMLISVIIIGISWKVSNSNTLILLLLFILASKNIDFKELVKYDWKLKTFFLIVIVALYYLGLTDNYFMYREDGTVRSSMGFSHPNAFGVYIFSICCDYVYIKYPKIKIIELAIILGLSLIIDYFSDSRGSQYSLIMLIIAIIIISKKRAKIMENIIIKNIILWLFVLISILSFWTAKEYSATNEILYNANRLLTGRIKLSNQFLNEYDMKLFGNKLELIGVREANETGQQSLVLDNAYLKLLLQYGILAYILFGIGGYMALKKAFNTKDYAFCIIFSIFIIRGFTGNILFNLYGNIFLLYISNYLYDKKTIVGEKNEEDLEKN